MSFNKIKDKSNTPERNQNNIIKSTASAIALSLSLTWCNFTLVKSDWTNNQDNILQDNKINEQEEVSKLSGIDAEINRAKEELSKEDNFEKRKEILEYIERLKSLQSETSSKNITQTQRPTWSDYHISFEQRETSPQQIFVSIVWWNYEYRRVSWKLTDPSSWWTKREKLELDNNEVNTNINKWDKIYWNIVFWDSSRSRQVEVALEYDWNFLNIYHDWNYHRIPIIWRNKWEKLNIELWSQRDRFLQLDIILDWR